MLAVRSRTGEVVFYPLVENHHRDGILRLSLAPAPGLTAELQPRPRRSAARVLEALNYAGVLAIEFFQQGERAAGQRDGAARPQLRPLDHRRGGDEPVREPSPRRPGLAAGTPAAHGTSAMLNLIGSVPESAACWRCPAPICTSTARRRVPVARSATSLSALTMPTASLASLGGALPCCVLIHNRYNSLREAVLM